MRLVEVVDVEDEVPLRAGEATEVGQVGIPAELSLEGGSCLRRQITGHEQGRAPVEGQRGGEHAAVANGHEFGDSSRRLALQEVDGIGPVRRGRELAE